MVWIGMLIIHMVSQIENKYSGAYNAANMAYAVNAITGPTGQPICADEIAQSKKLCTY